MTEHKSSWLCLRCGRAGTFAHQARDTEAIVRHIAQGEHSARMARSRRTARCDDNGRTLAIKIGETDYTVLCAAARTRGDLA